MITVSRPVESDRHVRVRSLVRRAPWHLTGFALSAATRTVWEDKVRTLGRSLASGLLAEDNAEIDTEQMIIAAITDIEGPQLTHAGASWSAWAGRAGTSD